MEEGKGGGKWEVSATIKIFFVVNLKKKQKTPVAPNDLSEVTQLRAAEVEIQNCLI